MVSEMSLVLLVDASSLFHRSYHGFKVEEELDWTGVVKGFVYYLNQLNIRFNSPKFIIVYDSLGKTFRHDLLLSYKGNRPPKSPALMEGMRASEELVEMLGLEGIRVEGWEADDIIGTLSKRYEAIKQPTVISTNDKDLLQLHGEYVSLYNPYRCVMMHPSEKKVEHADQIVDLLALTGDAADNIIGIEGVGPATASKLLARYGTIEQMYKDILGTDRELSPLEHKLIQNQALIKLNQILTRTVNDLPIGKFDLTSTGIDFSKLSGLGSMSDIVRQALYMQSWRS